eukprot:INCI1783.1.p1 GENE.INCI1783.1~~INCI1783.1.p1  ORF type:complete len:486 (-),score=68.46 INCI1783.1:688-2145(-)
MQKKKQQAKNKRARQEQRQILDLAQNEKTYKEEVERIKQSAGPGGVLTQENTQRFKTLLAARQKILRKQEEAERKQVLEQLYPTSVGPPRRHRSQFDIVRDSGTGSDAVAAAEAASAASNVSSYAAVNGAHGPPSLGQGSTNMKPVPGQQAHFQPHLPHPQVPMTGHNAQQQGHMLSLPHGHAVANPQYGAHPARGPVPGGFRPQGTLPPPPPPPRHSQGVPPPPPPRQVSGVGVPPPPPPPPRGSPVVAAVSNQVTGQPPPPPLRRGPSGGGFVGVPPPPPPRHTGAPTGGVPPPPPPRRMSEGTGHGGVPPPPPPRHAGSLATHSVPPPPPPRQPNIAQVPRGVPPPPPPRGLGNTTSLSQVGVRRGLSSSAAVPPPPPPPRAAGRGVIPPPPPRHVHNVQPLPAPVKTIDPALKALVPTSLRVVRRRTVVSSAKAARLLAKKKAASAAATAAANAAQTAKASGGGPDDFADFMSEMKSLGAV